MAGTWQTGPRSTLVVRDRINECSDGNVRFHQPGAIELTTMHRISLTGLRIPDDELDGPVMCAAFQDPKKLGGYTGDENPYPFLVRAPEGMIEQLTPLREITAHARAWNSRAVAIAVVGNFNFHEPDRRQWDAAVLLAAAISQALGVPICGHDELEGASRDPAKRCPGRLWRMSMFRADVAQLIKNNRGDLGTADAATSLLARAGVTFGG